jgi:hypothetical protein
MRLAGVGWGLSARHLCSLGMSTYACGCEASIMCACRNWCVWGTACGCIHERARSPCEASQAQKQDLPLRALLHATPVHQ